MLPLLSPSPAYSLRPTRLGVSTTGTQCGYPHNMVSSAGVSYVLLSVPSDVSAEMALVTLQVGAYAHGIRAGYHPVWRGGNSITRLFFML